MNELFKFRILYNVFIFVCFFLPVRMWGWLQAWWGGGRAPWSSARSVCPAARPLSSLAEPGHRMEIDRDRCHRPSAFDKVNAFQKHCESEITFYSYSIFQTQFYKIYPYLKVLTKFTQFLYRICTCFLCDICQFLEGNEKLNSCECKFHIV